MCSRLSTQQPAAWSHRGFSTLILGQYDREGKFVYAGFCGTGLSEDTRAVILEELRATHRKTCPFPTVPALGDDFKESPDTPPQWVRPSLVIEVEYRQRLKNGLRHAALEGLRPDKRPGLILAFPSANMAPSDRYFAATILAGRLHVSGIPEWGTWDSARLDYWPEVDLDLILPATRERKARAP